jgi:hypothetical protein
MSAIVPEDPGFTRWLNDLRQRDARGGIHPPVAWHRAKEPACIHSDPDRPQPASACRYCCTGPEYEAWVSYWRNLGAPGAT